MLHLMQQLLLTGNLLLYKFSRVKPGEMRAQYKPSPSSNLQFFYCKILAISLGSNLSQFTYIYGQMHITHIYK